jgi:CotH kinase protein
MNGMHRCAFVFLPTLLLASACSDEVHYHSHYHSAGGSAAAGGEAGEPGEAPNAAGSPGSSGMNGEGGDAGGAGGAGDASLEYPGAPVADVAASDHDIDVFGVVGNRYWFAVSDEERERMNQAGGGLGGEGDIYTPGGDGDPTYVDHLWVSAYHGRTADYGQVQTKVVGQSTYKTWDRRHIPNFNIDSDQFVDEQRIGGYEHLRFGNALVGNIFRERLALSLYRELGYPAPLATHAWVSSNVWGPEVAIPYVLVERYKAKFCRDNEAALGGGCTNMWEFVGDFNGGGGHGGPILAPVDEPLPGPQVSLFDDPSNCQLETCEASRVKELELLLAETPEGDGYKAALADWIAWPEFHRFQCLSWVMWVGDDTLHNGNNVVLVERADGLFQYLPYSVDISLGQDWYQNTPLTGSNVLARGCQSDASCWADTIAVCEEVIQEFAALEPVELLDQIYGELAEHGMLRLGDEARFEFLKAWLEARVAGLPAELDEFRELETCEEPMVDCGGGVCDYPENCGVVCAKPGAANGDLVPCALREPYHVGE